MVDPLPRKAVLVRSGLRLAWQLTVTMRLTMPLRTLTIAFR